jgi:uncharacterized membrane protein YjdF
VGFHSKRADISQPKQKGRLLGGLFYEQIQMSLLAYRLAFLTDMISDRFAEMPYADVPYTWLHCMIILRLWAK